MVLLTDLCECEDKNAYMGQKVKDEDPENAIEVHSLLGQEDSKPTVTDDVEIVLQSRLSKDTAGAAPSLPSLDGGYGWVILIATILVQFLIGGWSR